MRQAPWPDFAGRNIHEGDTIKHPSGEQGTVVFLPNEDLAVDQWRVDYGDVSLARLCLQIGEKGQAVVCIDWQTRALTAEKELAEAKAELEGLKKQEPVELPQLDEDAFPSIQTAIQHLEMLGRGEWYASSRNLADDAGTRKASIKDVVGFATRLAASLRLTEKRLNDFACAYVGTGANSGVMKKPLYAEPKPSAPENGPYCNNCKLKWIDESLKPAICPYCNQPTTDIAPKK